MIASLIEPVTYDRLILLKYLGIIAAGLILGFCLYVGGYLLWLKYRPSIWRKK